MVQSVELILDPELDAAVRAEWDILSAIGLPSQNRHTGASNRPHVTLGVSASMSSDVDVEAARAFAPFDVRLGGLVVFGGRTATVARLVVPSTPLWTLHSRIYDAVSRETVVFDHLEPGAWTPHVTLARRMTAEQVAAAVGVLAPRVTDLVGSAVSIRRWDGDARREWTVG